MIVDLDELGLISINNIRVDCLEKPVPGCRISEVRRGNVEQ